MVEELAVAAVTVANLVEEGQRGAKEQRRQWQLQQERWRCEEEERKRAQNLQASRQQLAEIVPGMGRGQAVGGVLRGGATARVVAA